MHPVDKAEIISRGADSLLASFSDQSPTLRLAGVGMEKNRLILAEEMKAGLEIFSIPSGSLQMRITMTICLAAFSQHCQN